MMTQTCKQKREPSWRVVLIVALTVLLLPVEAKKVKKQELSERQYWCEQAWKMAQPVLENMAKGELQKNMQTEFLYDCRAHSCSCRRCCPSALSSSGSDSQGAMPAISRPKVSM